MAVADRPLGLLARPHAPRVCAFGQPRLSHDGVDTPITGKPARVLAGLLCRRNGLSIEQLIDVVWPEEAPHSARSALHVHLGTLRKLLAGGPPGATIDRSGTTYRLALDGWDVDIDLVDALTDAAHQALPTDPGAAADVFEQALAIWTGPALVLDGEPLNPAITSRYEVARLDVEEARIDALVRAGRPAAAESIAIEMVDAEPYRERRWAQLMIVQAEQGRIADALDTFRRARRRLLDDLGVEPGRELQALQRSILTREPASVEVPETLGAPPPTLGPLIGRQRLLERVETAIGNGVPVVMLGPPGVGKTRLAAEVAARAASDRRQVGWVDMRNARFDDPFLRERVLAWARTWPGSLVVLDSGEHADTLTCEIVDTLRRSAPGVDVVITTGVPIDTDCAVMIVNPLAVPRTDNPDEIEDTESVQLLRAMLGLLAPNTAVPPALAAALCRQTDGLPLGIRLTAELARTVPLSEVAGGVATELSSRMNRAIASVLDHLDEEHRAAFADLSIVAGSLDIKLIAALTERDPIKVIDALTHHGLLQYDPASADTPYSVLEPVREAAGAQHTEHDRRAALDRLADHCIERASRSTLPTATTKDGERLQVALARELVWHRQAIAHLSETGDDRRALELVAGIELSLYALGWWATNTELQEAALAIPGPPSSVRARVHAARGRPGLLHQFDEGHLRAAIGTANQVGDVATCAKATYQLGIRRWWQGCPLDAVDLLERSREMAERCGDRFVAFESRRFGGVALVSAGEAERGFERQLDVLRQVEHTRGMELLVPHIRMYLGHCRRHVGDHAAAMADLDRARSEFERIGNRASLIHVCAGLAELHADRGRHDDALQHAARALEVSADGGIRTYDPWILCTIARVHASTGELERARASADAAAIALSTGWIGEQHRVAAELAAVCVTLGDAAVAARLFGVVDANDDRRELPFKSPAEHQRVLAARVVARRELGSDFERLHRLGATSSVTEALAPVMLARD